MPSSRTSSKSDCANPRIPNFAAQYAAAPALPLIPAIDAMKTIAGWRRRRSSGSSRCVSSIGARRFRRSVASTLAMGARAKSP